MHFIVRKKIKRTFECPRCQHVETALGRVNHRSSRYSLCAAVFQRVLAAFLANCLRFCSGSAGVRALPPFACPSCSGFTAAGSLPCSSRVGGRSLTHPVEMSPTSLSAWEKSLGCLARLRFAAPPSSSHRRREFWLGLCWSCLGRLSDMSMNMRRSALAANPVALVQTGSVPGLDRPLQSVELTR